VIMLRLYRVALRLLPSDLQRKHGGAMAVLFEREVEHARANGPIHVAFASARSVWDVIARAAYEQVRPSHVRDPKAPLPTARELLRGLASAFAVSFVLLTAIMLGLSARNMIPRLHERGASDTIAEVLVLAIPFNAALTIPMAVLVSVLVQFTRLGTKGTLAAALHTRHGARSLVRPVLLASAVVTALAYVVTAEIVPRSNYQLSQVLAGERTNRGTREMTIGQLREAVREAQTQDAGAAHQSMLQVEVQKKLALPASCMVFALAGMAFAFALPRGGLLLAVVGSVAVLTLYYTMLMGGETLADQDGLSPVVAMWSANAVLVTLALLATWRRAGNNRSRVRAR
jgi:lipopolysaccharide export LptBFGC system permease protein LptF